VHGRSGDRHRRRRHHVGRRRRNDTEEPSDCSPPDASSLLADAQPFDALYRLRTAEAATATAAVGATLTPAFQSKGLKTGEAVNVTMHVGSPSPAEQ